MVTARSIQVILVGLAVIVALIVAGVFATPTGTSEYQPGDQIGAPSP